MSSNKIRVQYSGFIIFAAQILSVFTGIIFLLLLTRISTKSPDEFGTWSFIFYLVGLFSLVSGLFPFWTTRFVARAKMGATKTGVLSNLILALVAAAIYLASVAPIMSAFHIKSAYLLIYLLAALQIVNTFMIAIFEGSLRAVKPQAIGFGLLIEELVKVSLAFVLVVGLNQLLLGAMIGLIGGASVQAVFYTWLLKDVLRESLKWDYLREWLKGGSAAFIYNAVGLQLVNAVFYLLVFFSGQAALGYYQAAVIFSTVISYAFSLAFALYPKMLAQDCPADVATSFKTMIMLALPIAAVTLTMAQSLLTVLKASYGVAAPVLMLLTVDTFVVLIYQFYSQCLLGVETLDIEGRIPLRQLVRSKIFKVFTIPYIQAAIALPALFFVLTKVVSADPVQAALYMVIIYIVAHAGTLVGLYASTRDAVKIPAAWTSIAKYALTASVSAFVLLVLPQTTTLAATFGKVLVGVAIYVGMLYAIDTDARKIVAQVWTEIRGTFRLV